VGERMKSAPVYFTIAQARFNPILTLDSFAPRIQEMLRKGGFPDFQRGVSTTINLANMTAAPDQGPAQNPLSQTPRYVFGDAEKTSAFVLEPAALSFQTTRYDVFETLLSSFERGLRAVEEAVNLSYTDRIGLRYLDAVFPKSGETLGDYLWPGLIGLAEKLENGALTYAFSENLVSVQDIHVRVRVVIQDGIVGFPPDLLPLTLKLDERFVQLQGCHATMDTDGWCESRQKFSVEQVLEQLGLIHTEIDKAFRSSVTENALKSWG